MLTGELRSQIDKVWNAFWTGGLSNPLTVIEQMTYLLFIKRLDEIQTVKEKQANILKKDIEDPIFNKKQNELRWSHFRDKEPESMYRVFTKEKGVFEFLRTMAGSGSTFSKYMKGATFMIPTPRLLAQVVDMLSNIDMSNRDTKGDVYEYLLSKIATSGDNGQFRTPRHIIKMMVAMMAPTPEDIICDPSAGTCGFLVLAGEYIREKYPKELLKKDVIRKFNNSMFMGMEFDPTMIRIGAMNMMLHGIENPQLKDVDALSEANTSFDERATLVLANPPFKGSLDKDAVDNKILQTVDSKKTELLFLSLILKGLKTGGRAAVIVPDGVLFGSSKAHKQIRKEIIEKHKLEAVISMPSGVFKPYAGVSTAVLIFTKTKSGGTNQIWFYDMQADGYSLDDKRTPLATEFESFHDIERLIGQRQVNGTDIPDILLRWKNLKDEIKRERTEKSFFVPVKEVIDNNYDLSINRYKEVIYQSNQYKKPELIIADIKNLDKERVKLLEDLQALIKNG
jgi:type I restriction enzyme M protein